MNFENIPKEMKEHNQWVCWKQRTIFDSKGNEKLTKIPFIAGTDTEAKTNDPNTWKTFDETFAAYKTEKYAGIGYVFSSLDPFCFIDLDSCIQESRISDDSKHIIDMLDSYTEISQSGKGIHIIVKARLPEGSRNRKGNFEIYTQGRFCAMTGKLFNGNSSEIRAAQQQINQICSQIFQNNAKQRSQITNKTKTNLTDNEIIELCQRAANKEKFNKLFAGDISEYSSASEADSALCWILAFYTHDAGQILNIVKLSGLYDQKWERADYQNMTIGSAIEGVTETYSPARIKVEQKHYGHSTGEEKQIRPFNLTDYGNAERLVHYHGDIIRYCETLKTWFIWDETRWKTDDNLEIERLAKDTVRKIYSEASICDNDNQRKAIADHAKHSEANTKIQAMITLAKSEANIIIGVNDLDNNGYLLNCKNGTIDLKTGELLPHNKDDYITRIIPITYDIEVDSSLWSKFLNEIFLGDEELIKFIKYSVGYTLTNLINEQCFFICYGTGANGKSVFLDTLEYLMGDYGKRVSPETFEAKKYNNTASEDLAGLKQIRYISTVETAQGHRLSESLMKTMAGGDSTIRARFLYQNSFEFMQTYKIWIATNYKPIIKGTDEGIWRKVRLIPFEYNIPLENQNKFLKDELREEMSGILNWALEGCLGWQKMGLNNVMPDRVSKATKAYREEMDNISSFISECCVIQKDVKIKATELYEAYIDYSGDKISRKFFGTRLRELGYKNEKFNSGWFWTNLGLKTDDLLST